MSSGRLCKKTAQLASLTKENPGEASSRIGTVGWWSSAPLIRLREELIEQAMITTVERTQ
jgi:hypothetical protein